MIAVWSWAYELRTVLLGNVITQWKCGGWKNFTFTRHKFLLVTVKEWLKSVLNYQSYPKNETGYPFFWNTLYMYTRRPASIYVLTVVLVITTSRRYGGVTMTMCWSLGPIAIRTWRSSPCVTSSPLVVTRLVQALATYCNCTIGYRTVLWFGLLV